MRVDQQNYLGEFNAIALGTATTKFQKLLFLIAAIFRAFQYVKFFAFT